MSKSIFILLTGLFIGASARKTYAQPELTSGDFLVPRTLEYEAYLDSTGRLGEEARERLRSPHRYFDGPTPGSFETEDLSDTLYVRLAIVNAAGRGRLGRSAIAETVADLNAIYGALPENGYGVRAVRFCPTVVRAPRRLRLSAARGRRGSRVNAIDFRAWSRYHREHGGFFSRSDLGRSIPVVVVDSRDRFLGFTAGTKFGEPGGDAIVIPRESFLREVRGRERSRMLAHLIANHLGLPALWAQRGSYGDHVGDTPLQLEPNFGQPGGQGARHMSMAAGMPDELSDNVMDNTWDSGATEWTKGQTEFLLSSLTSPSMRGRVCVEECMPEQRHLRNSESVVTTGESSAYDVSVRPNPVKADAAVEFSYTGEGRANWRSVVVDSKGQVVLAFDLDPSGSASIDTSELSAGTYWVMISSAGDPSGEAVCLTSFTKL